jgi:predicted alpha-1,6-mannanase (GH76 family)
MMMFAPSHRNQSVRPPLRKILITSLFLLTQKTYAHSRTLGDHRKCLQPSRKQRVEIKHARQAIATLNEVWLKSSPLSATWDRINAWQGFVISDSLTEYMRLFDDRTYLSEVERAVNNHEGLDGNDDDLWAVTALLNVYRIAPTKSLLDSAASIFHRIGNTYWDDTCGGGLWWDHERTYKNAITNELFLYAATSLYMATGDPSYSAWAHREWKWLDHSGLINEQGFINDGLDKACKNYGGTTYTYNQGVILSGLTNLAQVDGDPSYRLLAVKLAEASTARLATKEGTLEEPTGELNQDGEIFKGILVFHLGRLVPLIENQQDQKMLSLFLERNASTVWTNRDRTAGKINGYWDRSHIRYGAAAQAAGISLFNAATQTAQSPYCISPQP